MEHQKEDDLLGMKNGCLACLVENKETDFSEFSISTYETFLQEKICKEILDMTNGFCSDCQKKLKIVHDFRKICEQSKLILKQRLTGVQFSSNFIKIEGCSPLERNDVTTLDWPNDNSETLKLKIELTECPNALEKCELSEEFSNDPRKSRTKRVKIKEKSRNKSPIGRPSRTVNNEYTPKLQEVTNFCTVCATEVRNWNEHIKAIHSRKLDAVNGQPEAVGCNECTYIGRNCYNINRHFGQHVMLLKPVKCRGCSRDQFSTFLQYKNHWYKAHTRPKFQCDECGNVFNTRYFFKNHFFTKHRNLMYCAHCYTIFEDANEYEKHLKLFGKKKVKVYVCHICGQNVPKSLNEHMKYKHPTQDISVSCDSCGKVFRDMQRLRHHLREIHRERRYVCPHENCGKKFESKGKVERHIKHVHMEKDYTNCPECGKKLVAHGLVLHMRAYHPEIEKFHSKNPLSEKQKRTKKCDK